MSKVRLILSNLNIRLTSENESGYGQFKPPYRSSDNKVGASINLTTGWVTDWSEGSSFPIETLIKRCKGRDLSKEEAFLIDSIGSEAEKREEEPVGRVWTKESLIHLLPNHDYWIKRGISEETLKFFKGGLSHQGKLYNRYVWPVFNRHQQIQGFTGRDITGSSKIKYKHEGASTGFLFGVHNLDEEGRKPVLESIIEKREVILVEGPADSVACFDMGLKNVIPTFGLTISKTVLYFLLGINPKNIIIAYNRDGEANNYRGEDAAVKNHAKLAEHFPLKQIRIKYPIGNDLMDNKDQILDWYSEDEGDPIEASLKEYRQKYIRCRNNKRKNSSGPKNLTAAETKVGKRLSEESGAKK